MKFLILALLFTGQVHAGEIAGDYYAQDNGEGNLAAGLLSLKPDGTFIRRMVVKDHQDISEGTYSTRANQISFHIAKHQIRCKELTSEETTDASFEFLLEDSTLTLMVNGSAQSFHVATPAQVQSVTGLVNCGETDI